MNHRTTEALIEEQRKQLIRDIRDTSSLTLTEDQIAILWVLVKNSMAGIITKYVMNLPTANDYPPIDRLVQISPTLIRGEHIIDGKFVHIAQALVEGKVRYYTKGQRVYPDEPTINR